MSYVEITGENLERQKYMDTKTKQYAETLGRMIRHETVSDYKHTETEKFKTFLNLLSILFSSSSEVENENPGK